MLKTILMSTVALIAMGGAATTTFAQDIKEFRAREYAHITQYGMWKDGDGKDAKFIPISRAMQIVEGKGLQIESADSAKNDVTLPAVDRGYVARRNVAGQGVHVAITASGEKFLREHGRIG